MPIRSHSTAGLDRGLPLLMGPHAEYQSSQMSMASPATFELAQYVDGMAYEDDSDWEHENNYCFSGRGDPYPALSRRVAELSFIDNGDIDSVSYDCDIQTHQAGNSREPQPSSSRANRSNHNTGKKRQVQGSSKGIGSEDPGAPDDSEDDESNDNDPNKRLKTESSSQQTSGCWSCPFRKRNKRRFNVRDYHRCTQPFRTFAKMKEHLRKKHSLKLNPPNPPNPDSDTDAREKGFDDNICDLLVKRKDDTKIGDWDSLWRCLFPNDTEIPSPEYEPPVWGEDFEFYEAVLAPTISSIAQQTDQGLASFLQDQIEIHYQAYQDRFRQRTAVPSPVAAAAAPNNPPAKAQSRSKNKEKKKASTSTGTRKLLPNLKEQSVANSASSNVQVVTPVTQWHTYGVGQMAMAPPSDATFLGSYDPTGISGTGGPSQVDFSRYPQDEHEDWNSSRYDLRRRGNNNH